MFSSRAETVDYINPANQIYTGLWTLFSGATIFLSLRIWCKYRLRRTGLWYDDWMLVLSWIVLMVTDIIISSEYATGYSTGYWDDRMHILINISGGGTLIGQAWSKTALGITLLRMSNKRQASILWFCIISMNLFAILKVFFTWSKYCDKKSYQQWYRIQGPCISYLAEERIKVGGNTYNIIMDFVFALFPWWITWNLEMRRVEKLALCITMSLGIVIAVISTVRTVYWVYREKMHEHDRYYMVRNAMSQIWYSAEVAGTIIVQSIPILRPLLRDLHTSMTSKRISETWEGHTTRRIDYVVHQDLSRILSNDKKDGPDVIALGVIPEEPRHSSKESYSSEARSETDISTTVHARSQDPWHPDDIEHGVDQVFETGKNSFGSRSETEVSKPTIPSGPLGPWPLAEEDQAETRSPTSLSWEDVEQGQEGGVGGLSPAPSRNRWI